MSIFGFDFAVLASVALACFAAFVVRGLAGFGASMIAIGIMSMVLPPVLVIPMVMALEGAASIHLWSSIAHQIHWRALRWLMAGSMAAMPLGVMLLAKLDPDPMRLTVSSSLLVISLAMLLGWDKRLQRGQRPGTVGALTAGLASGLLNGAAGIGGPPAVVYLLASTSAAVSRASLIAYFLFTDLYMLALAGVNGMLNQKVWMLLAVALPFALLGNAAGHKLFLRISEAQMRRLIWGLLATLGAAGLLNAAWRLLT